MKKRPQFKAVLAWVNRIRKLDGKRPLKRLPKGDKSDAYSCPIARATGRGIVGYEHPAVGKFVDNFDAGKYPWLVR